MIDRIALLVALSVCIAVPGWAQNYAVSQDSVDVGAPEYSPYLHQSYPNRVFWGDTHLRQLLDRREHGRQHGHAR